MRTVAPRSVGISELFLPNGPWYLLLLQPGTGVLRGGAWKGEPMDFAPLPATAAWQHKDARAGFEVVYFQPAGDGWRIEGWTTAIEEGWTLRLDRIADARTLPGSFEPPAGLDPAQRVLSGLVELHAERLDWLPAVLASLDLPFTVERPAELRGLIIALANRLTASARASPPPP